ncbi:hypothetical protein ABKV19_002730 [Rosa sericea]
MVLENILQAEIFILGVFLSDQTPHHRFSKPWLILPSYLPWSPTPNAEFRSCEAYFGNGFTRRVDLLKPTKDSGSWFRCAFSETLRSSVCEGRRIRMVPERVKMPIGGEVLEDVIGRGEEEEEELPEFQNGAFEFRNDGHCKTQLEETWKALFSSLRYAKSFSGPVCFRHAIISPLGYETAWFKGLTEDIKCEGASAPELWQHPDDQKTARLSEFGEMIRAAFGIPVQRQHIEKQASGLNILFVRREDYLPHPRHGGRVESRLSNEQEVL